MYIRNVLRKKKINVAAGASVAAEDFQKTENEGDENNIRIKKIKMLKLTTKKI
jgi:hypothetical protein